MTQHRRSQSIGLFMVVVFSAVFLWALAAVVWPVPVVHADGPPEILTITVTSGLETYFYDPGLDPTGGTVYFNSAGGEGAGQVLTVTVTVTGTVPITLTGAPAFGDTPLPDNGEPWEIAYTVEMSAGTQSGIVFTATNTSGTDTAIITFTQDNIDPGLPTLPQARPDSYTDTGEYDDDIEIYFTWALASDNPNGSGIATYYAEIGDPTPDEDAGITGQDTDTGAEGLNAYYVAGVDHVGNVGSAVSDTITIDLTPPSITGITVTSNSPAYFYAPGLGVTGGEVYFNSLAGEGGGQTITVTVSWTDTNPYSLKGDDAFNDNPPADTSGPPWTVSYSIENNAVSQTNRVFTVTDKAGLTDTAIITFTQDNAAPTVEFTDVTDPDHDSAGNELDDDGSNWYDPDHLSAGWHFTSTVTDTLSGLALANTSWDHSNDAYDQLTYNPGLDGDGVFNGVSDDGDGMVTVTLTLTDNVGNSASDLVVFNLDNTGPDIYLPLVDEHDSPYLHVPGSTVIYYSHEMGTAPQPFDVEGFAEDDGVGLDEATYPLAFDTTPSSDNLQAPPSGWRFWSGMYAVDEDENEGDGSIQVTVSDLLGNLTYQDFFHIRDIAIPTVQLTDVIDPDYDPDGNELNTTGNWYRTGGLTAGWSFTSTVSDSGSGPGSADATWDHAMDNTDRSTDPGIDGDGVFTGVVSDGDGAVTVTLTITDYVGNSASDMLVIQLDGTAPSVPGNFSYLDDDSDSGGDGFLPEAGYYDDTVVDLEWDASTDDGSDLLTYHLGTAPQPTGGSYAEDSSYNVGSSGTYSIYLTAEDNVGNISDDTVAGPVPVVVDLEAPQVSSVNCPSVTGQLSFLVSWSGSAIDPGSGLRSTDPYAVWYDVDGGGWQSWITATSATMATFGPTSPVTVAYGHTYCFRMRAVDKAGNVESTSGSDCTVVSETLKSEQVFLPIIMAPDPNWGFETGDFTSWQHGGQLAQSVSTARPHSGNYSARLGSPSYNCNYGVPVGSAWISRSVTVPSSGSPTLSFWYRIYTHDINPYINQSSGYDQYDFFAVYINGSVLVVKDANTEAPHLCSILRDLGWKQVNYDLSTYKGQTIQISFYNYNRPDKWGNTYTYVDDVSVQ